MKIAVLLIMLCFTTIMLSITHIIDIDGTGQFTSIQAGLNAAALGDTVLVYPGVYQENIDLSNKSITVASLEIVNNLSSYRDSTIIDGNQNGSTVKAALSPVNSTLYGFTIINGTGTNYASYNWGGGIFVNQISGELNVYNCIIKNNRAYAGGGIYIDGGLTRLRNTDIYNNIASSGGGIYITYIHPQANVVFDAQSRCSVYENFAAMGNDIRAYNTQSVINVVLDMFTLSYPDDYYALYTKPDPNGIGSFTFDILRGYRQEVNHDLYVSPNGDDTNTGFSQEEPLKTIAWALHKIAPDSIAPKTIYVASGTYSTMDGQIFPLSMKSDCCLIGDSLDKPIIQNMKYDGFIGAFRRNNAIISNFTFESSPNMYYGCFGLGQSSNLEFSNIDINNVNSPHMASNYDLSDNILLKNIAFNNCTTISYVGFLGQILHGRLENISFNNCHSTGSNTNSGMILSAFAHDSLTVTNCSITNCTINGLAPIIQIINWEYTNPVININNLLISNNSTAYIGAAIFSNQNERGTFSNNTIVHNTSSGFGTELSGKWKVANSIFYDNMPTEINIPRTITYSTNVNFYNNLIENYPQSIVIGAPSVANFVEGNFAANPSFTGTDLTDPLSYRLNYNSPCIDAGTPDTTGLYLPEYDFYGNVRVYNGIIDIGCNEWDGTTNQDIIIPQSSTNIVSMYPNPSRQSENITFETTLKANEIGTLTIYNLKGQKVKSFEINAKNPKLSWNSKDENHQPCAAGMYLYRLNTNKHQETKKLVILK